MRNDPAFRVATSAIAAVATLALALPPRPAAAQSPVIPTARNEASTPAPNVLRVANLGGTERVTIPVGRSIIVDLPADAAEIFVGKPEVANAVVRSPRRLYVMALAKGPTTIFAMDKDGRQIAILSINVTDRDIGALTGILKTVLPDNDIRVQAVDDTVILTGTVASAVDAQRAFDIASAFTGYTAIGTGGGGGGGGGGGSVSVSAGTPQVVQGRIINSLVIRGLDQVTLKVSIVEIRRDVVKQLGVNLTNSWSSIATGGAASSITSAFSGSGSTTTGIFSGQKNSLTATLQAFESNGVAHTLAEPNVTAISGETAKFLVGGTIPILQSSTVAATTLGFGLPTCNYVQQQYGVTLNFTPTVLSGGRISLHVSTAVTEPDPSVGTPAANTCGSIPGFRQRQNETTVELPSGGSIVSAGLVQQTSQQTISGTPGLFNLPILGALFRSRQYQRNETELMIVVTPYISKTLRPDQISKPDDGFTDSSDPQSVLLGRMNRIYSTADNPELARSYRGHVGFIND